MHPAVKQGVTAQLHFMVIYQEDLEEIKVPTNIDWKKPLLLLTWNADPSSDECKYSVWDRELYFLEISQNCRRGR